MRYIGIFFAVFLFIFGYYLGKNIGSEVPKYTMIEEDIECAILGDKLTYDEIQKFVTFLGYNGLWKSKEEFEVKEVVGVKYEMGIKNISNETLDFISIIPIIPTYTIPYLIFAHGGSDNNKTIEVGKNGITSYNYILMEKYDMFGGENYLNVFQYLIKYKKSGQNHTTICTPIIQD